MIVPLESRLVCARHSEKEELTLDWRARTAKSINQYIDEKLTDPQRENHQELISELNDNLLTYIGRNRFSSTHSESTRALAHVKSLTQVGPFTAGRATEEGLLNGTCYRQDVLDSVLDPEFGGDDDAKLMGFYHYAKVVEKAMEKYLKEAIDVGVVYLMGTIGDPGECVFSFGAPCPSLPPFALSLTFFPVEIFSVNGRQVRNCCGRERAERSRR